MQKEPELIYSPLQQAYTISDQSIESQIYRLPDTGWTIELVDEHGNATVWNDEFATDQLAFDEVSQNNCDLSQRSYGVGRGLHVGFLLVS